MSGFTSGYLQEVTGDLDGPACTVCGAIMVTIKPSGQRVYWVCESCGEKKLKYEF